MKRILMATLASWTVLFIAGSLFFVGHTQTLPAPTVDRVGFPAGYRDTFTKLYTFDNFQNRQIRVVYGNDVAASVQAGEPYPYGSILVGEFWPALRDAQGEPVLDENGRFVKSGQPTVFVMRKERGFGKAYKSIRNGEWEYVSYRPDGTYATRPEGTTSCATCHHPIDPIGYDLEKFGAVMAKSALCRSAW